MARRYSHRPLFPNPVVSFFLFWLGYILNGSTLPPSVTFCTARYVELQSSPHSGRLCLEDSDPWRLRERNPKVGKGDVPARWPGMRVRAETPGPPAWKGA